MADQQKILEEIEGLEGKVATLQELVKSAKSKLLRGENISKDELDMVVERITKLETLMRERRDVGH